MVFIPSVCALCSVHCRWSENRHTEYARIDDYINIGFAYTTHDRLLFTIAQQLLQTLDMRIGWAVCRFRSHSWYIFVSFECTCTLLHTNAWACSSHRAHSNSNTTISQACIFLVYPKHNDCFFVFVCAYCLHYYFAPHKMFINRRHRRPRRCFFFSHPALFKHFHSVKRSTLKFQPRSPRVHVSASITNVQVISDKGPQGSNDLCGLSETISSFSSAHICIHKFIHSLVKLMWLLPMTAA